ncbi:MAG TPA: hypothetical protein VMA13_05075 [Candidatus Saccharimonadales bacterium]|nr:hypothetical protein [Candidatus Saccharimonadales bacterium]
MKRFVKMAVYFASGLVLNTSLHADSRASSNNPYEPIVTRNIFGLNPPQPVVATTPEPPSKITPDGIMTIFGTPQVLFYVDVPPHPPTPATQKSYILSEGQQQDDIEVTHIDEKAGVVTFNNHGVIQQIPLAKAPPLTTPTPVVMNSGFAAQPGASGGFRGFPGGNSRFGNRSDQNRGVENSGQNYGNNSGYNPGGNFGDAGNISTGGTAQQEQQQKPLSPEEQMIMIAAEHAEAQKEGNPMSVIYPPTPLDDAAGVTLPPAPPGPPVP